MCDLSIDSVYNEQTGIHPVLIVSSNIRNQTSENVFVFPITHASKKFQPTHYKLFKIDYPFFTYDINTITCEEGRSISKKRIRRYVGSINEQDLSRVLSFKDFIFFDKNLKSKNFPIDILQKHVYNIEYGDKFKDEKYGLVVQCNKGNSYSDTTIIIPIIKCSNYERFDNNIHYHLYENNFEFINDNVNFDSLKVKISDITSINKSRVINCVGKLNNNTYEKILNKLRLVTSELEIIKI